MGISIFAFTVEVNSNLPSSVHRRLSGQLKSEKNMAFSLRNGLFLVLQLPQWLASETRHYVD